jgi:hypothetical protein
MGERNTIIFGRKEEIVFSFLGERSTARHEYENQ